MLRLITARYALVQWADKPHDPPCCITLESIPDAIRWGATVIGREDAILEEPIPTEDDPA